MTYLKADANSPTFFFKHCERKPQKPSNLFETMFEWIQKFLQTWKSLHWLLIFKTKRQSKRRHYTASKQKQNLLEVSAQTVKHEFRHVWRKMLDCLRPPLVKGNWKFLYIYAFYVIKWRKKTITTYSPKDQGEKRYSQIRPSFNSRAFPIDFSQFNLTSVLKLVLIL